MAAVFDSISLERQAKMKLVEAERQRHVDVIKAQLSEARIIRENNLEDWTKSGALLVTSVLEQRLLKLAPALTFITRSLPDLMAKEMGLQPGQKTRAVMRPLPDGSRVYTGGYLHPIAQEFDVIIAKKVVLPAIDPATGFLENRISNIPDPKKYDLSKPVYEGDNLALTADEQYVAVPDWRIPGWRSVLLWLLNAGVVTVTQVEREFLTADRASWATKLGKQSYDNII